MQKREVNPLNDYYSSFFVVRSPILPLNQLKKSFDIANYDLDSIAKFLFNEFKSEKLNEGLYLASPVLHLELDKAISGKILSTKDKSKLVASLLKYYVRASSRCTPFGLFASCTFGKFDNFTSLKNEDGHIERHLRLDMDFLCFLVQEISKIPDIKANLSYSPNSTIYKSDKKIRYIEYKYSSTADKSYHLTAIDSNAVLTYILKISSKGLNFVQLANSVIEKFGYEIGEIQDYIDQLIANKILISNLEANVTGTEYFLLIRNFLNSLAFKSPAIQYIAGVLNDVHDELESLSTGRGHFSGYRKIFHLLTTLNKDVRENKLFQLDSINKFRNFSLSKSDLNSIFNSAHLLALISDQTNNYNSTLETFKRAFSERYEEQFVKLTHALDSELGIGYRRAKSLGDHFNTRSNTVLGDDFILSIYLKHLKGNAKYMKIVDDDIFRFFGKKKGEFPNSLNIMLSVYHVNNVSNSENYLYELTSVSNSATRLFGRFCHADSELEKLVKEFVFLEESSDAQNIYAEISHLPQSRMGNILARPHLRNYEIPYLANSTLPNTSKISVDDLYIKMEGNELILYSTKLKKRVIPRLTSAHNYSFSSLPMYNFLCDLQFQGEPYIPNWNWGKLELEAFLPRVMYGTVILSPARWNLAQEHIKMLRGLSVSEFSSKFIKIKNESHIPDNVIFHESDNKLIINTTSLIGLELLRKIVVKNNKVSLHECIWDFDSISDQNIVFAKELIIPLLKGKKNVNNINYSSLLQKKITRNFIPGSEWIYFKVYMNPMFFDKLIVKITSIIASLISKEIIYGWFFVRYTDPKPHLRIRIHLKNINFYNKVIGLLFECFDSLVSKGSIHNLYQGTYVREIERYGVSTMELSERIFYQDTYIVSYILGNKSLNQVDKVIISFWVVNFYINNFLSTDQDKMIFIKNSFSYYSKEFLFESNLSMRKTFQNNYRKQSKYLDFSYIDDNQQLLQVILNNSNLKLSSTTLKEVLDVNKLSGFEHIAKLLSSYIHMFFNRLVSENPRFIEFTIYYYLHREYVSKLLRSKN